MAGGPCGPSIVSPTTVSTACRAADPQGQRVADGQPALAHQLRRHDGLRRSGHPASVGELLRVPHRRVVAADEVDRQRLGLPDHAAPAGGGWRSPGPRPAGRAAAPRPGRRCGWWWPAARPAAPASEGAIRNRPLDGCTPICPAAVSSMVEIRTSVSASPVANVTVVTPSSTAATVNAVRPGRANGRPSPEADRAGQPGAGEPALDPGAAPGPGRAAGADRLGGRQPVGPDGGHERGQHDDRRHPDQAGEPDPRADADAGVEPETLEALRQQRLGGQRCRRRCRGRSRRRPAPTPSTR